MREPLGIFDELQARRVTFARFIAKPDRVVRGNSAAEVSAPLPSQPKPEPVYFSSPPPATAALNPFDQILAAPPRTSPRGVVVAFISALTAIDYRIQSEPINLQHLMSPRRSHEYVAPRHVAIGLVKTLCPHLSLPMIGRFFGQRDHTSIMHAIKRVPHWLAANPDLAEVAAAVIARFKKEGGPA